MSMRNGLKTVAAVVLCAVASAAAAADTASPGQRQVSRDGGAAAPVEGASPSCALPRSLVELPGLIEASGLAASRRGDRLWAHNDSGQPIVHALDASGKIVGQVRLTGAKVEDWEAMAIGPCDGGSCLYLGDIGDNDAERRSITVYRVPEPEAPRGSVAVKDVLQASYPDGSHDAETLLVAGDGRLYIVTKGETGHVGLYRFPQTLQAGTTMRLERVSVKPGGEAGVDDRITDGSVSPDGETVVLRTLSRLEFYRAADFFAGKWQAVRRMDLKPLKETQGEGVALGADGMVYLAGEGGGRKRPGTFARFRCAG
jgi:hypothetical protein